MKKPFLLEKYRLRLILCLIVTSFVAGILIGNALKDTLVKSGGILNPELLYELKYAAIDKKAFFFYVLRERLLIFLILIVLSTTWLGMVATYTCCVWMGISFGMLCAVSVLQYGLKGIFLIMAGVFPQGLIYLPVSILFLEWSRELCRTLYYTEEYPGDRNREIRKKAVQYLAGLAALTAGCLLEGYISPGIVGSLLKVF